MPSRPISGNPRATAAILISKILFVATTLSVTAVIFSTVIYILYHFWSSLFQRSRTRPFEELTSIKLQKFTYKELKSATNNFNPENAIGKGGSGLVFRGILRDGKSVAVKLIDPSSSLHAEKEFQNELTILGSIKSPLIVSLLGFCVCKNKRILVYEYMPNRSLQELLFCDENPGVSVVGWDRRFQIIQDVARALEFLHNECDPPVIHGDIKPSNVLLDWDFKAKVCDFGLSRVKVEDGDQFGDELFSQEINNALALQAPSSSQNGCLQNANSGSSPKGKGVLRIGVLDDELYSGIVDEHCKDEMCLSPSRNVGGISKQLGKDWWWKQDSGASGELCSKDYVMEWIGSQICEVNLEKAPSANGDASRAYVRCDPQESDFEFDHHQHNPNEGLKEKHSQSRSTNEPKKMQDWWKEESLEEMRSKKRCQESKLRKMSY